MRQPSRGYPQTMRRAGSSPPPWQSRSPRRRTDQARAVVLDDAAHCDLRSRTAVNGRCRAARCDEGGDNPQKQRSASLTRISLRLDASDVLGILDDYATRSGYLITPVVVWAGLIRACALNPKEVASVHRIPLTEIMRPDAVDFLTIPESKSTRHPRSHQWTLHPRADRRPDLPVPEVLAGRDTRVNELEQPVFAWR